MNWGHTKTPALVGRAVVLGFATAAILYAMRAGIAQAESPWASQFGFGHGDWQGYLEGARRFLDTGTPYEPQQLSDHWQLQPHSFIHPPVALLLFVPFLWLPLVLWWAIPILGTAVIILAPPSRLAAEVRIRGRVGYRRALYPAVLHSPWRILAIVLCIAWPRTIGALEAGNSDIWAMFFVALGTRFGWPVVLLAIKPTFVPVGLLWIRDRRVWIATLLLSVAMIPLLPLWFQWLHVVTTAGLDYTYSVPSLPLIVLPIVAAWRGGSNARRALGRLRDRLPDLRARDRGPVALAPQDGP